jgi:multiple sugar transport system permease protein
MRERPPAPPRRARRLRDFARLIGLIGPALFLMAVFLVGPLVCVVALSFTDYQLGSPSLAAIGFDNYVEMANDSRVRISLVNTLTYAAVVVPGSVILGLGVALLIEADRTLRSFYRAAYFLPMMTTLIAMAVVWEYMLDERFGVINMVIKSMGMTPRNWLHDRSLVLYTLCGIGIWQNLGYNMVLFMAGLTSIPRELYEAAAVDGARRVGDRFWLVTWPMLGPITLFTVVISAIRAFQVFDTVQVLTLGGPNKASEVLLFTIYSEAFSFFRDGYASALVVVFLVIVLALSATKVFLLDKRVHYS